nr:type VII secretion target [Nocardioides albus]
MIDSNPADMIKVTPSDMRRAAEAWDEASDQVKNANPTDRVPEVATAMPGSAAAGQVAKLSSEFHRRFKSWCEGATEQADALRNATAEYESADQLAADEGRRQESVISHGMQDGSSGAMVNRGPAVLDPGDSPSARMSYLDKRMGGDL